MKQLILILIILCINFSTIASVSKEREEITTVGLRSAAMLKSIQPDKVINAVIHCPFIERDLAELDVLTSLVSLDLSQAQKIKSVRSIPTFSSLKYLNLSSRPITDEELEIIPNFTSLEYLILSHTGIIGSGLTYLEDMSSLRILDLSNTDISNATDIKRLLEANSNLTIILRHTLVSKAEFEETTKIIFN